MFMIWKEKPQRGSDGGVGVGADRGSPAKAQPHLLERILKERLPRDADLDVAGEGIGLWGRKGREGPTGCAASPPPPAVPWHCPSCSPRTHMAKEAELVKLPAEAPVVSAWGAPLLAPRRGDRVEGSHSTWGAQRPSCPCRAPAPRSPPSLRKATGVTEFARQGGTCCCC